MPAGDTATVSITDRTLPADRAAVYFASLAGDADAFGENDQRSAGVLPIRQLAAWVASGAYRLAGLEEALARGGVQLRHLEPREAPASAAGWNHYAAVILLEPGPGEPPPLTARQRAALAEHVRAGGGLLQVGTGPHRTPGDREDPVNRVAALVANPYERKPLKVIVVLDASGSMDEPAAAGEAGMVRFDLAVEAVIALRRHLTEGDRLAVITFSNSPQLIYDSGERPIDFSRLHSALKRVVPGGRTVVFPALQRAGAIPVSAEREGLLVLVSDLLTEPFDPRKAEELFAGRPMQLAIVAVNPPAGSEPAQAPLRELAESKRVKVTLRPAGDLAGLAEVFVDFLKDARGEALRLGDFALASPGGAKIFGAELGELPATKGYYVSAAQRRADVVLQIGADPVMAARPAGLGRVVSLAVPLRFTDRPGRVGGFDPLMAAACGHVLRRGALPGFAGTLRRRDGQAHIELTAYDPSRTDGQWPVDGLELYAEALRPGEEDTAGRRVALRQRAPGRYEAKLAAGDAGLGVSVRDSGGRCVWQDTLGGGYADELASIGPNWDNLHRLARLTGGRIVERPGLEELARQWDRRRFSSMWPYALAASLALMLLDWAAVRVYRRA
jgi:hypothetical protein